MKITKTINFKIEDMASTNRIMGQRGTMFVEVILSFIDSNMLDSPEYDRDYSIKWSSSFSENEPYSIADALQSEVIELLLNSYYDEEEVFTLDENKTYDLSYFEKYDIEYMITHDCKRVEALINLATKSIVEADITYEALDADAVDKLVLEIKESFNKHEGNSSDKDMSESKIRAFADILKCANMIEFTHNGFYYEIFESAAEHGYTVNLYSHNEKDEDSDYLLQNLVDGGICSGSSRDAIEFML